MVRMSWNNFDKIYQTFEFDQMKRKKNYMYSMNEKRKRKINLWILPSLTMLQLPPRHPAASVFPYTKFGWFLFVAFDWTVKIKWKKKKEEGKNQLYSFFTSVKFIEGGRRQKSTECLNNNNKEQNNTNYWLDRNDILTIINRKWN